VGVALVSDVTRRNRSNKRKGADYEIRLEAYLKEAGWNAVRVARRGRRDEGDVHIVGRERFTWEDALILVEAKNADRLTLPAWLEQARVEAQHVEAKKHDEFMVHPIVVAKRRGKSIGQSYVVQELDTFLEWL
jgi:Holliday junction resolvase